MSALPHSVSRAEARGRSAGRRASRSRSASRSESLVPFIEHWEDAELASRTYRPIEEQLFLKLQQLKAQPNQHAAFGLSGRSVDFVRILD